MRADYPTPVRTLAIDTSSDVGSVAISEDGQLLLELLARVKARHGETLLPRIRHALDELDLKLEDLDLVGVGVGPGSFTGTRVGLATAKGLCFATGLPLVGVGSLRALARAALSGTGLSGTGLSGTGLSGTGLSGAELAVPLVDAHKGEVFAAVYELAPDGSARARLEPFHAAPERALAQLGEHLGGGRVSVMGSGARRYAQQVQTCLVEPLGGRAVVLDALLDTPRAMWLAHEAERDFLRQGPSSLQALEPAYVRGSDAKLPA